MTAAFLIIALLTLATAGIAMCLRNLIHSALLLVASWAGIAAFYLWAGAEFVAFAQMLVYVGAVSMIVLFAVLLSRAVGGLLVGGPLLGVLVGAVVGSDLPTHPTVAPSAPVRQLGNQLMTAHVTSVLIAGVILTVALIGAVVLAAADQSAKEGTR